MQWKEAIVIPLLKHGKPATDPTSYRPIALTNCLCKIMEKILNKRLNLYIERNQSFTHTQSGFRASHSTLDALIRLEHSAREAILERKFCVAVFLDIEKAFDSVWHHGLLSKIHNLKLTGHLPKFIQNFISLRKINARIGSTMSSSSPLFSGVPQGSVLSPTLFNIFINDIFSNIPAEVNSSLYADDGAIWITDSSLILACNKIQLALNSIEEWSSKWGLTFNVSDKTKAIIFTNKRNTDYPTLYLHNTPIPYKKSIKFLGLIFDHHLTWNEHISNLQNRCKKDIQLLSLISYHNFGADFTTLRKLYTSLIIPKLDYAGFVFDMAAETHLKKLDRIQFAAIRVIVGAIRCTPTIKLGIESNLMPLSYRRQKSLVQYVYRIATIPNHPTRQILIHYTPKFELLNNRYILSSISRAYELYKQLNISIHSIPTIQMTQKYSVNNYPIYNTISLISKHERSELQWQHLYQDLIENTYNKHIHVFTDGSKKSSQWA